MISEKVHFLRFQAEEEMMFSKHIDDTRKTFLHSRCLKIRHFKCDDKFLTGNRLPDRSIEYMISFFMEYNNILICTNLIYI